MKATLIVEVYNTKQVCLLSASILVWYSDVIGNEKGNVKYDFFPFKTVLVY